MRSPGINLSKQNSLSWCHQVSFYQRCVTLKLANYWLILHFEIARVVSIDYQANGFIFELTMLNLTSPILHYKNALRPINLSYYSPTPNKSTAVLLSLLYRITGLKCKWSYIRMVQRSSALLKWYPLKQMQQKNINVCSCMQLSDKPFHKDLSETLTHDVFT